MTDENVTAQPADQSPGTPPAGEPLAKPDLKDAAKLDEDELLAKVYRDTMKEDGEGEQKPAASDKDEAEAVAEKLKAARKAEAAKEWAKNKLEKQAKSAAAIKAPE